MQIQYAALSQSNHFIHVVVETAGIWHTESLEFVKEMGSWIKAVTDDQREISHLFQRVSVAL